MPTMKSFMEEHHGKTVETIQTDLRTGKRWTPGLRIIDAKKTKGTVWFRTGDSWSCREYKGMRITTHPDYITNDIIENYPTATYSDDWHMVTYIVKDGVQ